MKNKNIFITGMPRSGTTWLGKIFKSTEAFYELSEPFNPRSYNPHLKVNRWFEVSDKSSLGLERTLGLKKDLFWVRNEIKKSKYHIRFILGTIKSAFIKKRILLKDPISFFNIDFFYEKYNFIPVIVIKHPASIITSFNRVAWDFNISDFLENQDFLKKMHTIGFDISYWQNKEYNSKVEELCAIWNLFVSYSLWYKEINPDVAIIKLEDIIRHPFEEIKDLFNKINITFNQRVIDYINISTTAEMTANNSADVHILKRDSNKDLENWKNKLESEQIIIIKELTKEFGEQLYPEFYRL